METASPSRPTVTPRSSFPRGAPPRCDSLHRGRGPINYRRMTKPTTLGELKQTEWASPARIHRTVKDELRENLICLLENGSPLFPGIVGYEDSVIPQLVNAVLSRHNFILLGLRGQAKSRILRQLVTLLDEEIPILAGSEVRSEEHTSELQSRLHLVCRLLLEKKKNSNHSRCNDA